MRWKGGCEKAGGRGYVSLCIDICDDCVCGALCTKVVASKVSYQHPLQDFSLSPPHLCRLSLAPVAVGGVDQNLPVQVSALRPGGVAEQWVFLLSLLISLPLSLSHLSLRVFLSLPLAFHLSLGFSLSLPLPFPLSFLLSYFLSLFCLFCLCCHQ